MIGDWQRACRPGTAVDAAWERRCHTPLPPITNHQPPITAFLESRVTNHESRLQTGFTLIELLVVVVIVAALALALTIAIGGTTERQLANEAERFQALLAHACDEAELGGREIGVALGADGYAFLRLDGSDWHPMGGDALRARAWRAGLRTVLKRDGRLLEAASPERPSPQIVCFSSGELTPFELALALGDAPAHYVVRGGDEARPSLTRVEAPR